MEPADAPSRTYPLRMSFGELMQRDSQLAQLEFASRQFLHLMTDEDATAAMDRFPKFDSESVQLRPGVHLYERLHNKRVQIGGSACNDAGEHKDPPAERSG